MWIIYLVLVAGLFVGTATLATRLRRLWAFLYVPLLLLACISGDWLLRNLEFKSLVTATEASEAPMHFWNTDVQRIRERAEGKSPSAIIGELRTSARDNRKTLLVAINEIERVRVAPWHFSISQAHTSYESHAQTWSTRLHEWSVIGLSDDLPTSSGEISATWEIAESDYLDALPLLPLFDLESRVEDIFDE